MSSAKRNKSPYKTDAQRWSAVKARDPKADGYFVYAVRTTGVYCRPSSSTRLPHRKNVEFFSTAKEAEAAGYRRSRRTVGDQTMAAAQRVALVAQACRLIESSESPPTLEDLASRAEMSPFHFHRIFKSETGLTPRAYASASRARRLRKKLTVAGASVTDAIYGAGFNSNSRFYEASDQLLGMRARDYRAGGAGTVIRFAVGQCSLGAILVAQSQRGICAILLGDDPETLVRDLEDQFPKARLVGGDSQFERLVAHVVGFIEAPSLGLNLPLDIQGTAFQERVWQALREVPFGATVSYTEVAKRIGAPKAVRAVAQACDANQIAVAIPCHRVVRRNGDISGYRWGVDRKRKLLQRESRPMDRDGTATVDTAVNRLDWEHISRQLDIEGYAILPKLLGTREVSQLKKLVETPAGVEQVNLASIDLGRGIAFPVSHPPPTLLADYAAAIYCHLVPVANRWNEILGKRYRYSEVLDNSQLRRHDSGQLRGRSYLSSLIDGEYQELHQNLESAQAFPLQLIALLSEPGRDFTGGEFVITERHPRMQSRPTVLPLQASDVAIITTAQRPTQGMKGYYRVNVKHAISRVHSGKRVGLELSFEHCNAPQPAGDARPASGIGGSEADQIVSGISPGCKFRK